MATGDSALAVQTCATVAPKIAAELSQAGELKVQRVSLKPRNAKNDANAVDQAILKNFEKVHRLDSSAPLESLEELGDGQLRYLGGIRIKPLCLSCHGTNISAPLRKAIQEHYPQDRATGYRLGDVRGAFRIEWTLPIPVGLDAQNLRAPRIGLVTGGAPSTSDIPKLKKLGFSWVIDLRSEAESDVREKKLHRSSGMHYVQLPVRGARDINFKKAQELRALLNKAASSRIFLHCASGNRVGALLALIAYQDGASINKALEQGRASGMRSLESRVKTILDAAEGHSGR